ncbi:MAG: phenylalanine--tRNA ligase subunit beta [Bacteroidales bacterium]|nr:phenylalanine--tRNA ligase subunit beta [Bacteroidales bacterium]
MKISYNWLKEYVPTKYNAEEIADLLTFSGLEVEGLEKIESIKGGLNKYVIGKVLTCEPHPNSDHLHITTVDVGSAEPLHIVCGAPNVAAGQTVVVATIGAKVYDGEECFEIKKSKLRGEISEGMICSEKELQLSNNHDGIMVLPSGEAGMPAKDYFQLSEDTVLEIGLTANRSDAASHLGVGRDLVAILASQKGEKVNLLTPNVDTFKIDEVRNDISITIDQSLCGRYSGLIISDVKVGESPKWLKEHLSAIGIRSINNIVDITNFVLMETGQPLHAFDLKKIKGNQINVRTLPKGTKFITLDGIERELNGKEAVVCNESEGMCLAGIFGGAESGVKDITTDIFLESAYFNPVVIRKAAKYHQLSTDASFRYERGADPNITVYALKRAALLIKEIAGGKITSEIKDIYPEKVEKPVIDLHFSYLDSLVGKRIEREKIKDILNGLNIEISEFNDTHLVASIPTNKVDVTRPCDLAEEILRIYGYDNIDFPESVKSSLSYNPKPDKEKIQYTITAFLASNGFNETMNNSLTSATYYNDDEDYPIERSVKILNALSTDLDVMRQSLLYSGLEVLSFNINRKVNNLKTFEFGNCYNWNIGVPNTLSVEKRIKEEKHLSLFVTGKLSDMSWQGKPQNVDFFYLKNIVMLILQRLRINPDNIMQKDSDAKYLSQGLTLVNRESKKVIATLGSINGKLKKQFDIKQDVFYADLNWDAVLKMLPKKDVTYQNISKFPAVKRDLALVVDKDQTFDNIEQAVKECDKKLIRQVTLFDVYDKLQELGKKQYAISIILQDEQKTLTDKQIETTVNKIINTLETKCGAKLR